MARVSALVPLLTVEADAKPSNYLVNHVSWSAPTDAVNWSEIRLTRSTSGYPMNVNEGVSIFSESSYSVPVKVTAVHTDSAIGSIEFSGGGKTTSGLSFEYYYAVPQYSVTNNMGNTPSGYPNGATTYATGATFDVTRSSKVQGDVSDVSINSPGGGYEVGNVILLSKNNIGYLNSDGSENLYGGSVADLYVIVTSVTAATGGIRSITATTQPILQSPAAGTFSYSNIASVGTDTSIGSSATFDVVRVGDGSSANTTTTLRSSGVNYKVGDIVRIPGQLIGGRVDTTELGKTNAFHVYDTGADLATVINPGYGVTGTDLRAPKYYYSLFIKYLVNGESLPRWKKLTEISSYAIKDQGNLDTLLGHLPLFYRKDYQGKNNKDLIDFISLFAFHYDMYLAHSLSVFNASSISTMDDNLIKLSLKQFGFDPNNVVSITQARTLLGYLIKMYQGSGSVAGIADFIEGLTSYGTSVSAPRNLLNNYDTSSFVDTTGFWYPEPTSSGYGASAPYASGLTLTGPTASTTYGTTTTTISSYANQSGITLTNASSSGYVISVDSTAGLTSGVPLAVPTRTGVTAATTSTTSTTLTTSFAVTGDQLVLNAVVKSIVSSTGTVLYSSTTNAVIISGVGSGTVTLSTTPTAITITPNSLITTTVGTGSLTDGTVVTSIVSPTQFKISATAPVALSGQALVTSTNISSGMAKIVTTSASAVTFKLGLKDTITATNYASGTNVIVVKPLVAAVGDTAIASVNSTTTGKTINYIPVNTKVTNVNSATGAITLSKNISAVMATGTSVLFAPTPATDKVGAFSSLMTVSPASPYAFSLKTNPAGTTLAAVTVGITWYDKTQTVISTASNSVTPTASTSWTTVGVSGVAPATAVYAQPYFSARNNYFVDGIQFEPGISSNALAAINGDVSVITDLQHNFIPGNTVSVSGYGPPYDGTFPITSVVASTKTVTYTLGAKAIHDNTNTTGPILLSNSPAGITMTGASSSGAVITVASNTGLKVGHAIKKISGTGAFSSTTPTYVTAILSPTQFTVNPIPVTPLSGATIANGFVTYFTPGNNFVPGNRVKIATIMPFGLEGTGYEGVFTVLSATSGAFVIANTTTSVVSASSTGTANILWTDGYAKAAMNDNLNSSALVASQSLFEDARTTTVKVLANRRNLVINPSFEVNTAGWTTSTSSITLTTSTNSTHVLFGSASGKLDIAATTTTNHYITNSEISSTPPVRVAVTPSTDTSEKVYAASAYVKRTAGSGITYNIQIAWFSGVADSTPVSVESGVKYYKADGTLATAPANVSSSTGWNRLFVISKAPTSANFAEVRIIRTDAGGGTSTVYVDGVLFEPLSVLKNFFDGSFDGQNYAVNTDIDSTWEGTAHNSVSHLYYNRVFNTGKIDSLMTEGMFYA